MTDTSIIEVARQTHEEAERYQQALVDLLIQSTSLTHKEKLKRSHKASDLLDRVSSRYRFLDDFYNDTSAERSREMDLLSGPSSAPDSDMFTEFYSRLAKIKDYHQKYPGALPDAFTVDFDSLGTGAGAESSATTDAGLDFVDRMFSGEEMAGRFLDLYLQHDQFLNLKGVKRNTYLRYLDEFDKLVGQDSRVPDQAKSTDNYKEYIAGLRQYLSNFLRKTQPLSNVDEIEARALATFDLDWDQGKLVGWQDQGEFIFSGNKGKGKAKANSGDQNGEGIWCEACRRSYSKQTVYDAHLKSPKHLKAAERLAAGTSGAPQNGNHTGAASEVERIKRQVKAKALARDEILVMAFGESLASLRADTKANVERKAALTDRERQAEAEGADEELNRMTATNAGDGVLDGSGGADDDEEAEEKIYNPLRLPLGWDGRPIPYWLYKLHGLSVEFKCEICSDFVYQGR